MHQHLEVCRHRTHQHAARTAMLKNIYRGKACAKACGSIRDELPTVQMNTKAANPSIPDNVKVPLSGNTGLHSVVVRRIVRPTNYLFTGAVSSIEMQHFCGVAALHQSGHHDETNRACDERNHLSTRSTLASDSHALKAVRS